MVQGVDMTGLVNAGIYICHSLGKQNNSRVAKALIAKDEAAAAAAAAAAAKNA